MTQVSRGLTNLNPLLTHVSRRLTQVNLFLTQVNHGLTQVNLNVTQLDKWKNEDKRKSSLCLYACLG